MHGCPMELRLVMLARSRSGGGQGTIHIARNQRTSRPCCLLLLLRLLLLGLRLGVQRCLVLCFYISWFFEMGCECFRRVTMCPNTSLG
jgi:hypothetical protein